jgi:creatinine amidohydrolase
MVMKWAELTAPDFARAVRRARGVCLVPVGVVEKHGEHLPLGTDFLYGQALAERAAAIEPAVVFPPYYFGQIPEARHQPGTISLSARLMYDLLEEVCAEIARNGLRKVVLLNCHGGNRYLPHFTKSAVERERDYLLYLIDLASYSADRDARWQAMRQTSVDGHAGEKETSTMLAVHPELVKLGLLARRPGLPRRRLAALAGAATALDWYADFPDHYMGDGRAGSAEKGRYLLEFHARRVAALIRAIKRDRVTTRLLREYHARSRRPAGSRKS